MIGIQLAGKNNRIAASVFIRSINSFWDLIKDVDSTISNRATGSVRWEIASLQKNSPALVEFAGTSRIEKMDYSQAIQDSILDGIDKLTEGPEQPQFYSYSALRKLRRMADQAKHLKWLSIVAGTRRAVLTDRVFANIEYIIATGSKSLGSVRGSLDSLTVHAGHEFKIWSAKTKRPIICHFEKTMLPEVIEHLKQQVEVFGELHRNPKGEPVIIRVDQFTALEPAKTVPSIHDICGMIPDLYGGKSLKGYLEELRNE